MTDNSTRRGELSRYDELIELRDKERQRIAGASVLDVLPVCATRSGADAVIF